MNEKNNRPPQSPTGDVIQAHLGCFMAELSTAGYTANTLRAKRVALDRFLRWRHRRTRPALDLSESEIGDFLTNSFAGDRSRRSVASRALFGFLAYLRGCRVLRTAVLLRQACETLKALSLGRIMTAAGHLRSVPGVPAGEAVGRVSAR